MLRVALLYLDSASFKMTRTDVVKLYILAVTITMEILAMKVITFVYNSVAKVSSYISIGLLALGIIVSTSACNRENIATIQQGSEDLASSPAALKVEQIKPENPDVSKPLPKSNLPHSSRTLPTDTQAQNVQLSVEQKEDGKLRFVNDTPYMSIMYIYASAEKSYRYAYVPPCTTRELYDTYSNSQLIRLNGYAKFPIAKKAKREGDFFAIKMSALGDDGEQKQLCEFNPSKAVDIFYRRNLLELGEWHLGEIKKFVKGIDEIPVKNFLLKPQVVDWRQTENISMQLWEKMKQSYQTNQTKNLETKLNTVKFLEPYNKLQELIWLKYLSSNGPIDEQSKHLLSSTRRKIESGQIQNVNELVAHLNRLKEDPYCASLYKIFLDNMINAAPKIYQIFVYGKLIKDSIVFSPGGQPVKIQPLPVNNVQFAGDIQTYPQCASTRNNNPIFTLISDHSRPRLQTVLQ